MLDGKAFLSIGPILGASWVPPPKAFMVNFLIYKQKLLLVDGLQNQIDGKKRNSLVERIFRVCFDSLLVCVQATLSVKYLLEKGDDFKSSR